MTGIGDKMYGVALFGLGRMGIINLKNIINQKQLNLLYIVEPNTALANELIEKNNLKNTKIVTIENMDVVFNDKSVDGCIISTPTDTHEDLLSKSLHHGKHVLCEKPISKDIKVIAESYKLAKEKQLTLLCAFNRRFDPQLRKLKERKNEVGKLHSIKSVARDSPFPKMEYIKISGGIFHDCVIHDIDLLIWVVGELPQTVFATGHAYESRVKALDDFDTVMVSLQFPSGIQGHIDVSRFCSYGYDQTLQIFGEDGNLKSENIRESCLQKNGGQVKDNILYSFDTRYADAYVAELNHFVRLMAGTEGDCEISGRQTVLASCICDAIEDSCRSGQPIKVKTYVEDMLTNHGIKDIQY